MNMMRCAAPLLVLLTLSACGQPSKGRSDEAAIAEATAPAPAIKPLAAIIDSLKIDAKSIGFKVHKSKRRFEVVAQGHVLKSYSCVLGEVPVGDKFHQGDRKTPEGSFTFRSKRVHAQWHKFIWVDYPNAESWKRYNERKAKGLIPRGKDIGGEIGIHGVPEGMDHWIDTGADWTWGCIALRNADVDEVYPYIIAYRTMMEVLP
ncbi:MAG: L,D-transpeptidase family protein [Flavobacteriales bacterium]